MKILNFLLIAMILAMLFLPFTISAAKNVDPVLPSLGSSDNNNQQQDGQWTNVNKARARFTSGVVDIQSGTINITVVPFVDGNSYYTDFNADNSRNIETGNGYIKYKRSGNNPNITYYTQTARIKDTVIIKKQSNLSYVFTLNGASISLINGRYVIRQGNDSIIIENPVAWDNDGNNVQVSFNLVGNTLNVNYIALQKQHPITIDPTYLIATTNQDPEATTIDIPSQPYWYPLTVDNSTLAETFTNFVAPIIATPGWFNFAHARSDGGDIRFSDGKGTLLSYETELYNGTATGIWWVKIPNIPSSGSTTIWLSSGDPTLTSIASSAATWAGTNYLSVYHLKEQPVTAIDSVGSYNGTGFGPYLAYTTISYIDGGLTFNNVGTSYYLANGPGGLQNMSFTLEAWVKPTSLSSYQMIISKADSASPNNDMVNLSYTVNGQFNFFVFRNSSVLIQKINNTGDTSIDINTWSKVVATYNNTTTVAHIYVNGVDGVLNAGASMIGASYTNFIVGINSYVNASKLNAQLDEVRTYSGVQSANRVKANYMAETNTYITKGSEQQSTSTAARRQARLSTDTWVTAFASTTANISGIYLGLSADNGQTWTIEAVSTASAGYNPALSIDSTNNVYVVWQGTGSGANSNYQNIYLKERTSAGVWGAVELVTDDASNRILPAIVTRPTDSFYIFWAGMGYGVNSGNWNLELRTRSNAGVYGGVGAVTDTAYNHDRGLQAAVNSTGDVNAVWETKGIAPDTTKYSIQYANMTVGVLKTIYASTAHMRFPDIATDLSDISHISWLDTGANKVMYETVLADGITLSTPQIAISGSNTQHRTSISIIRSTNQPVISVSGLGYGVNVGKYNIIVAVGSGTWTQTTITDTTNDHFDVSLLYSRYPVIAGIYTNIPDQGYAGMFYIPGTGSIPGEYFFRSTDLAVTTPQVTTNVATNVSQAISGGTTATLNGTLNSMGGALIVSQWFEWGYTASLGNTVGGSSTVTSGAYSYVLQHFTPGQTVYYRYAASNVDGTNYGSIVSFGLPVTFTWQMVLDMPIIFLMAGIVLTIYMILDHKDFKSIILIMGIFIIMIIILSIGNNMLSLFW